MPAHGCDVSVLLVGHEPSLRDTYALLFHEAGYIACAVALDQLQDAVKGTALRLAVFDHTLSERERKIAVQTVRSFAPQARTVALHSSAKDCGADLNMDSREGPLAILERVGEMLASAPRKASSVAAEGSRRGVGK